MKTIFFIVCLVIVRVGIFGQGKSNQHIPDYDRTIVRYFFVELTPKSNNDISITERESIQQNHLNYIKTMTENGQLVLAGPFDQGGGLFFLKAPNYKAAEEIVKKDPSIQTNLNSYKIRSWYTERGLFTLEKWE